MKVLDILGRIDFVAPFRLAEEWDNVGLMVGDPQGEVRRLALTLDPLPEAVEEASRQGCQGLLTHHPLFFKPIRGLDLSSGGGQTVRAAVKAGITVLAAHTNWDKAKGGVSQVLAERLGLTGAVPLIPTEEGGGLGAVGDLPTPTREVLDILRKAWNLTWLDLYGQTDRETLRVALCGGSGGNLWPTALAARADLFVTADMRYHDLLDCTRSHLPVAVADHGEMESATLPELARRLAVPGELEVILLKGCPLTRGPLRVNT
ncbi:MAG: Nif3-like dinuclear metal center hexameric protein [Synergistaceae bacterium]|jgi:dinuclear metal center YbgI/SA1388 family protein|nr:Nif3-like dinuclear metal center hexameric protein [Synergistaceae bacterium]